MTRKRWIWIALSVVLAVLLGTLATSYNVALVQDYHQMLEYARNSHLFQMGSDSTPKPPKWSMALGTLGFVAALMGVMIFMFKILREMRLNQLQSEFIAHVSHELKTPIATMELTSSLLRSDEADLSASNDQKLERRHLWSSHDEELKRLKRQVEDLLEAARWQAGPPKVVMTSVHLGQWIEQASLRWRELLGGDDRLEIAGDALDFTIQADTKRMELIFGNIIENAKKFARGAPQVSIRTQKIGDQWTVSIRDQGLGFPPEQARKIFARFHRATHDAPYAIAGSGLGLYLCENAARSLGWRISATSHGPGTGAEFRIDGKVHAS